MPSDWFSSDLSTSAMRVSEYLSLAEVEAPRHDIEAPDLITVYLFLVTKRFGVVNGIIGKTIPSIGRRETADLCTHGKNHLLHRIIIMTN